MRWVEIRIRADDEDLDQISSSLNHFGHGGTIIEKCAADSGEIKTGYVKLYLPFDRAYQNKKDLIIKRLAELKTSQPVQTEEKILQPADWFDPFKKLFDMQEIGQRIVIKPVWKEAQVAKDKIIIEMDPGMAFGTGLHATTRLCLVSLEKHLHPGMKVLDLGTGSGILAIAAAKLGASQVIALDTDAIAVKAARQNSNHNHVEHLISIKRGTLSLKAAKYYRNYFDLAVANITASTISALADRLAGILKPSGILIVSGISDSGLDEVLIRLTLQNLQIMRIHPEGEWYAVVASKSENKI